MSRTQRRVVISGLGPVCTGGSRDRCRSGRARLRRTAGISRIGCFDASGFRSRHGGEIPREVFNVRDAVPKSYRKATKVMARDIEFAVGGSAAAVADAGLVTKAADPDARTDDRPRSHGLPHRGGPHRGGRRRAHHGPVHVPRRGGQASTTANGAGRGWSNLTPLWLLKYLRRTCSPCHVTIIHDCQGPPTPSPCAPRPPRPSRSASRCG